MEGGEKNNVRASKEDALEDVCAIVIDPRPGSFWQSVVREHE